MAIELNKEHRDFIADANDGTIRGKMLSDQAGLELLGAVFGWILSNDVLIQFFNVNGPAVDNSYAGPKEGTDISIGVTSGDGVLNPFNNTATVVLSVTGGTATSPKINGSATPVTLSVVDGKATATITATAAGTVLLGLSGGNTTLDRTDTATVALS